MTSPLAMSQRFRSRSLPQRKAAVDAPQLLLPRLPEPQLRPAGPQLAQAAVQLLPVAADKTSCSSASTTCSGTRR